MEIHTRKVGPILHLVLIGELSGGPPEELLTGHVDHGLKGGCRFFALDFSRVTYINSTGLGALVRLSKELSRQGADVCIANPLPHIHQVFRRFQKVPIFAAKAPDKIREWTKGMADEPDQAKTATT